MNNYKRFAVMMATSTVAMFALMYLATNQLDHLVFSVTRVYMALAMGALMTFIMLAFMQKMYANKRLNTGIFVGSIIVFVIALWLVRSQALIGDIAWMQDMIPHHSIAILTSEQADLSDPRVRGLADRIIETQRQEIAEIRALIQDLEHK